MCRGLKAVSNSQSYRPRVFFVLTKERAKTDSVMTPAGPMVAWYGSFTVDEAASTFAVTVEGAIAMCVLNPIKVTQSLHESVCPLLLS